MKAITQRHRTRTGATLAVLAVAALALAGCSTDNADGGTTPSHDASPKTSPVQQYVTTDSYALIDDIGTTVVDVQGDKITLKEYTCKGLDSDETAHGSIDDTGSKVLWLGEKGQFTQDDDTTIAKNDQVLKLTLPGDEITLTAKPFHKAYAAWKKKNC